jgi:HlyD family secretion protein
VLDAQEAFDEMKENSINPVTTETYTDTEQMVITKSVDQQQQLFSVAEKKYLDADAQIANARTKAVAALRVYQENSAIIVAPATGVVTDLALAEDIVVAASASTSSTSGATIVSAQIVGKINDEQGQLIATVNVTELDVISVKAKQKVTLTFDAYPEKSFTGQILAVNTSGVINSGVTNYPVTVLLDPISAEVYPNMAVNTEIITQIIPDVILVPVTAIQQDQDQSVVLVKQANGEIIEKTVEVGDSNDTYTAILSGLNEGEEVVVSTINSTTSSSPNSDNATSPFSGIGGFGTGGRAMGGEIRSFEISR